MPRPVPLRRPVYPVQGGLPFVQDGEKKSGASGPGIRTRSYRTKRPHRKWLSCVTASPGLKTPFSAMSHKTAERVGCSGGGSGNRSSPSKKNSTPGNRDRGSGNDWRHDPELPQPAGFGRQTWNPRQHHCPMGTRLPPNTANQSSGRSGSPPKSGTRMEHPQRCKPRPDCGRNRRMEWK